MSSEVTSYDVSLLERENHRPTYRQMMSEFPKANIEYYRSNLLKKEIEFLKIKDPHQWEQYTKKRAARVECKKRFEYDVSTMIDPSNRIYYKKLRMQEMKIPIPNFSWDRGFGFKFI